MAKKLEVEVVAYERVEYRQTVTMTQEEFDHISEVWDEEGEEEAAELLLEFVDRGDVCGADNPEIGDMKIATPEEA